MRFVFDALIRTEPRNENRAIRNVLLARFLFDSLVSFLVL
jgi:hypothetical protein